MSDDRAQLLIIVSRREAFLCAYLKQIFEENDHVEVVLDRRVGPPGLPTGEGGSQDRREHDVDSSLRALGWAIVQRPAPVARD